MTSPQTRTAKEPAPKKPARKTARAAKRKAPTKAAAAKRAAVKPAEFGGTAFDLAVRGASMAKDSFGAIKETASQRVATAKKSIEAKPFLAMLVAAGFGLLVATGFVKGVRS